MITKKLNIETTEYLNFLSHETGIIYSKALVVHKRILRKKNIWLSKNSMQKILKNKNLHSQTTQGIIDVYYANLESYFTKKKNGDTECRMPKRRKWFFNIVYKKSAIRVKDNMLILSNGKRNKKLIVPWNNATPKMINISYNHIKKSHQINAVYDTSNEISNDTNIAGIDLGEIHIAVANTGKNTYIINGKKLRCTKQYQNKAKAKYKHMIDVKKKGSKRRKKLINKSKKSLGKIQNQVKDICQKQTTKLVSLLKKDKVKTVGIGDLTNIRKNIKYGKKNNQKLHQWNFAQITQMIKYKAMILGMEIKMIDEHYTSQTCPSCGNRHKPSNRNYKCKCGYFYHRDGVGAINIRSKTKYQGEIIPVVGTMALPIGFRY